VAGGANQLDELLAGQLSIAAGRWIMDERYFNVRAPAP